jgi:hypothetical protein
MVSLLGAACGTRGAARPRVEQPSDLPAHVYRVPPHPGALVVDAAAFAALARALRADLEHDLAAYDVRDPAVMKEHLFNLAILDALDGRWQEAVERLDRAAARETRPAQRQMMGLTIRVWAAALAAGRDDASGFREALQRKLEQMPLDLVGDELRQLVTLAGLVTPQFCQGVVELQIGPAARQGDIPLELAEAILFQRWLYLRLIPVAPAIGEVVGARLNLAKPSTPSPAP